jgi:WD40 repeat protein
MVEEHGSLDAAPFRVPRTDGCNLSAGRILQVTAHDFAAEFGHTVRSIRKQKTERRLSLRVGTPSRRNLYFAARSTGRPYLGTDRVNLGKNHTPDRVHAMTNLRNTRTRQPRHCLLSMSKTEFNLRGIRVRSHLTLGATLLVPIGVLIGLSDLSKAEADPAPELCPRLVSQVGHGGWVSGVTWFAHGRCVVTSSEDGTVKLWDVASGRLIRTFLGHVSWVSAVAGTRDGRWILTGSFDRSAKLWDPKTGRIVRSLEGHSGWINAVAILPNGRSAVTASDDKTARIWDVETGCCKRILQGHLQSVKAVAFSPSGRLVATGSEDATARIWNVESGDLVASLVGHNGSVTAVAFDPSDRYVLTGSEDRTARLWEVKSQRPKCTFSGHTDIVSCVTFSSDGRQVLTGSYDKTARLWDLGGGVSGRTIRVFGGHILGVTSIAISPDGHRVVTGSQDKSAIVCDLHTGSELQRFEGHEDFISSLASTRDGSRLLVESWDRSARLWDMRSGRPIRVLKHDDWVSAVAISSDGRQILTASFDRALRLWDGATGRLIHTLKGHSDRVTSAALLPDGRRALSGSMDKTACLWDTRSGLLLKVFKGHADWVNAVGFMADGHRVLTASSDRTARLWNAETADCVGVFKGHDGPIDALAIPRAGSTFATSSWDKTIRVWDTSTGRAVRVLKGHDSRVGSVCFSPDGRWILSGSADRTARLWSVQTGQVVRVFEGHTGPVDAVVFLPDELWILTASGDRYLTGRGDRTVRLWDVKSGKERCALTTFEDGSWTVVSADGLFDSSDLEEIEEIQWIFPDDPFHPLPPEIFLRDYFTTRLLRRLLDREASASVRPLGGLNRIQPGVHVTDVRLAEDAFVARVTVEIVSGEGRFGADANERIIRTDAYDLRVFREGRLVAQWPRPPDGSDAEPQLDPTSPADIRKWRETNRIKADGNRVKLESGGKLTLSFPVRLPSRSVEGPVEFTAYAFNEDRVKSETAHFTYKAPANRRKSRPRAYLVGFGVSTSQNPDWKLMFAASDAKLTVAEFAKALNDRYEVVPVELVSEGVDGRLTGAATRDNLRSVLQLLAGQTVSGESRQRIPHADRLALATPDDLVLLALSCHGYMDQRGTLYLLPYDVGEGQQNVSTALPRCISSGDLSAWLRSVDAGEFAMTLDACHSAAAGAPPGFKPGPFGDRGLAQLAYDKGMRVLAASQAKDVALECESIQHGLLTYALIREGLQNRQALRDGKLTLRGLLSYASDRVPDLYEEIIHAKGALKDIRGRQVLPIKPADNERSRAQKPELFDYASKRGDIPITVH